MAGQALVAAGRSVPGVDDGPAHSLHAYFIRPGDPAIPILYEVDRLRDGRSFSTRRVAAIQRGEAIFRLSASFQAIEDGASHQESMPDVPDPETLPTWHERMAPYAEQLGIDYERKRPVDVRYVDEPVRTVPGTPIRSPQHQAWLRAAMATRPASTTPCGSTGRAGPMTGCCRTSAAPPPAGPGAWPWERSSPETATSP